MAEVTRERGARWPHVHISPVAWGLLLLGGVCLLYITTSLLLQAQLPSDGVLLTELSPNGVSISAVLHPLANSLQVGDHVLAVDGTPVWEWVQNSLQGAAAPACFRAMEGPCQWRRGQVIIYRVERDGMLLNVPVMLRAFPLGRLPLLRFGAYGLALVTLVVCAYIMFRQPTDMAAQLLFVMSLCLTMNLMLHNQMMVMVTPQFFKLEFGLKFLCRMWLFSVGLHVFLLFPVPKAWAVKMRYGLLLLHLLAPAAALLWGWRAGPAPLARLLATSQAAAWMGLFMLAATVLSVVHTYITASSAMVRGQIRWVAWGTVLGIIPYILFTGLPEALSGQAVLPIEITAFFVVLLPISLAIAVVRYRLLDIDTLLWRTLFYALFSLLCVGIYMLLENLIESLAAALTGRPNESSAVFLAAVGATCVFWVLRHPLLQWADRFLFSSKVRPDRLAEQVTRELVSAIHLEQLSNLLARDVPQLMGAMHGGLMVLSEDEAYLEGVADDRLRLPLVGEVTRWIKHGGEPIVRRLPPEWVAPEIFALLDERRIEVVLPLRMGEQVVGIWGLGPREGRLTYTTADLRLLRVLAHQAALAVQNARLVRSMQTHQQRLEDEVRRRTEVMIDDRNRLNAILQNMADALLVTDPRGQIRMANPAFENLVHRSLRKMLGHNVKDVLPLSGLMETIRLALRVPGVIHTATMSLTDPTLSAAQDMVLLERILRASVTALGDGSAVICVLRDITHEVEVDRMKSEFISAVSHELRTPLTSILGFAKLTHRTFEKTITPALSDDKEVQRAAQRVHRNLDIMVTEGERLTTLINDVLDIAALDAGTLEWNDQLCEVSAVIGHALQPHRAVAAQKGVALSVEVAAGLPLLRVDPERLQQVLGNMLSNAIKFTDTGRVTVRAWFLPPETFFHELYVPAHGAVAFAIEDTGVGIPAEDLTRIFERFSQGGDTLLDKPHGTGLGLAICQEIILHYGGDVWVMSELGVGSTFEFMLPLTGGEIPVVDAPALAPPSCAAGVEGSFAFEG